MNAEHSPSDARDPAEPNLRPGPQDHGGHGGMATREQEQRVRNDRRGGDRDDGGRDDGDRGDAE